MLKIHCDGSGLYKNSTPGIIMVSISTPHQMLPYENEKENTEDKKCGWCTHASRLINLAGIQFMSKINCVRNNT